MTRADESGAARTSLVDDDIKLRTSPCRWYLLLLLTLIAGYQGSVWSTFGPIGQAVKPFFGWDNGTLAMINNFGPITYFIAVLPSAWLLDVAGLRASCIFATALMLIGAILRCVHVAPDSTSSLLIMAGMFIHNLAAPVTASFGPLLSATWFAPHERNSATAFVSGMGDAGISGLAFLIGPWLVPAGRTIEQTQEGLRRYMLADLAAAAALFIGACTIPRKPPFAPSRSARVSRTVFLDGIRGLTKLPAFWLVALCYGVVTGFCDAWVSMLGPNMEDVLPNAARAEVQAGWLGFLGLLAGGVGGVLFGLAADRIGRRKGLILFCCFLSGSSFLLFALFCSRILIIPNDGGGHKLLIALFATGIGGMLGAEGTIPLFFEAAVECAYPIAEGLTTVILITGNAVAQCIFLLVQGCTSQTNWMNWAVTAACVAAFVIFLPLPELQKRKEVDAQAGDHLQEGERVQEEPLA